MDEDSLGRSTEYQDLGTVFAQLVRVGTVTDVNYGKRIARVPFHSVSNSVHCGSVYLWSGDTSRLISTGSQSDV